MSYFLGLEIDRRSDGFFISQKKYVQDLLKEFNMLEASPLKLPMNVHMSLNFEKGSCCLAPALTTDHWGS